MKKFIKNISVGNFFDYKEVVLAGLLDTKLIELLVGLIPVAVTKKVIALRQ